MSANILNPAASMSAADIDLRCALVFARAAIKGVSAVSPETRAVVLAALDDEAMALTLDPSPESHAVAAVIAEARRELA